LRLVGPDDAPRSAGEEGEVIVSNLVNRATVLLNYRLGDIARQLPDACPCGRSLPLLSFPAARAGDAIELASGRLVHPYTILGVVVNEPQIWQYRVVQHSHACFSVQLVVGDGCDRRALRTRVVAGLQQALDGNVQVDVSFPPTIERSASGKILPVVSLLRRAPQPVEVHA
jgi:phenylacetate-CoA ligase